MTKQKVKKVSKKSQANQARSKAMKALWNKKAAKVFDPVTEPKETVTHVLGLSAQDVKEIISSCHQNQIMSFQYGDLRLRFKKTLDEQNTERPRQREAAASNALKVIKSTSEISNRMELEAASDAAIEELEHLKITDPAAYEAFISSEDAINDGNGN